MQDHHLVRRLMSLAPDQLRRPAIRWSGGALDLGALRTGMLQVAGWLAGAGLQRGDRVAVCLPKSAESVQAMYGILAAGGTYVPLHFQGPPARLAAILASVRPRLLLTTPAMAKRLAEAGAAASLQPIAPQRDGDGLAPLLRGVPASRTVADVGPDDLAWVIFTSGSTGVPKGVMLSHRNMAANVGAMQDRDRMSERDVRISHAALHYEASFDLLFPLVAGVRIFLLPEREALFPERVAETLERERSTIWSSSATALRLLLERGGLERRDLSAMRRISFYGEPIPPPVLRRLMAAVPEAEFTNHYGATEIDNIANFSVPRPLPADLRRLPLGRPTNHCRVSLRDEEGREVPPGDVGEICVVSAAVARGYWADPALTAAKRLADQADSFRTGDFGFFDRDGLLHPAGRKDQMVKIRGHRLDLGEVEAVLKIHCRLGDAVAIAIGGDDGTDIEIRAAVLAGDDPGLLAELRRLARECLPAFAQPGRILALRQFPLLAAGKVDRQALRRLLEEA